MRCVRLIERCCAALLPVLRPFALLGRAGGLYPRLRRAFEVYVQPSAAQPDLLIGTTAVLLPFELTPPSDFDYSRGRRSRGNLGVVVAAAVASDTRRQPIPQTSFGACAGRWRRLRQEVRMNQSGGFGEWANGLSHTLGSVVHKVLGNAHPRRPPSDARTVLMRDTRGVDVCGKRVA